MINIQKDDPVQGYPELFVYSPSGDYAEVDLVQCYHQDNPSLPVCAFAAQQVKFGNMVYHQEQPLNENQVTALEANAPIEEVINNEDLVDGKIDPMSLAKDAPKEVSKPAPKTEPKPKKIVEPEPVEESLPVTKEPEIVPPVETAQEPEPVDTVNNTEPTTTPEPAAEAVKPEPQVGDMVGEAYE